MGFYFEKQVSTQYGNVEMILLFKVTETFVNIYTITITHDTTAYSLPAATL